MKTMLPDGVWPTMLTPFNDDGSVDYQSLKALVNWYIGQGVDGLFAVCQSSEMFFLTPEEQAGLARATVDAAAGRVPVIASGHTADSPEEQIRNLQAMAETGVDALVLVTNRLAAQNEDDDTFIRNLERIVGSVDPAMALGFYECPHPYKRLLSEKVLKYALETGRFSFLKDTCCDSALIRSRLQMMKGSEFKLFNANAATLGLSLTDGASGYSGVMANFHPALYGRFCKGEKTNAAGIGLQDVIGPLSLIESGDYPLNAKLFLKDTGVLKSVTCRKTDSTDVNENERLILRQMRALAEAV